MRSCQAPFFENLVRGSTLPTRKKEVDEYWVTCISPTFNNVIINKGMDHLFSPFLKIYYQEYHWTLNIVVSISPAFNNVILSKAMNHLFSPFLKTYYQMYHWVLHTVIGKSPACNYVFLNKGIDNLSSLFLKTYLPGISLSLKHSDRHITSHQQCNFKQRSGSSI